MDNGMSMAWGTILLSLALGVFTTAVHSGSVPDEDSDQGFLLVANKGDQTLSILDPRSGSEVARVPDGGTTGHEVAASPAGQTAWVPIYGNSGVGKPGTNGQAISIIDLEKRARVGEIDLKVPSRPHSAVFGPLDGKLYVTSELTRSIQIIDPASRTIVGSVPTDAPESHMMTISPDGARAYTANVGGGSVSVVDLKKKKVLSVIRVAKTVQRIALSVDGRWVFTADQSKPQIAVIDTTTNRVANWISLPALGYGMAVTRDGSQLLVAHPASNSVSFVDLTSMKISHTIHLPATPQEILVRPDNRFAYVSCDESKQVAVIDLSKREPQRTIAVGPEADGLAWSTFRTPR
jgi:YVTN family beta-propeller protein